MSLILYTLGRRGVLCVHVCIYILHNQSNITGAIQQALTIKLAGKTESTEEPRTVRYYFNNAL